MKIEIPVQSTIRDGKTPKDSHGPRLVDTPSISPLIFRPGKTTGDMSVDVIETIKRVSEKAIPKILLCVYTQVLTVAFASMDWVNLKATSYT